MVFPLDGLGLLDLPVSVRDRIYKYAGPFGQVIDLNFSNLRVYHHKKYPEGYSIHQARCYHQDHTIFRRWDKTASPGQEEYWECAYEMSIWRALNGYPCCARLDGRGLIFVCRQISNEVVPLFYANNFFTVRQGDPYGLRRLTSMPIMGLQALRSLTIRLDTERSVVYSKDRSRPPGPLSAQKDSGRTSLAEYKTLVDRLARHITPNICELYLIFRVATFDLLEEVLVPLFQLPNLKNCGLWTVVGNDVPELEYGSHARWNDLRRVPTAFQLPSARVEEMELVLESAIRKLVTSPPSSFRYLDLPTELRLHILRFSGLVSADGVQWRPQGHPRRNVLFHRAACTCTADLIEEAGGCICGSEGEVITNAEWYERTMEPLCCGLCMPGPWVGSCFCSRKRVHIFSSSCKCPPFRHPLFSVSRQVREDAITTYYSLNRFFVTPFYSAKLRALPEYWQHHWPQQRARFRLTNTELSLYLSSLSVNALKHIRWLEWILPHPLEEYLVPNTRPWFDYLDTLDMMRNSMNIENLTFVLNVSGQGLGWIQYSPHSHKGEWTSERQIALALHRLGRLKDCFIYLSRYSGNVTRRVQQEVLMEKAVMGKDYDSRTRGKPPERLTATTRAAAKFGRPFWPNGREEDYWHGLWEEI